MYKRKDSDIFGTDNIGYAPRIENNSFIDPNMAFKKKVQSNYQKYTALLSSIPQTITSKHYDASKVNQNAHFQDDYHKIRKESDMQSSIFYPPTSKSRITQTKQNNSTCVNKVEEQVNFGRKQTFKRQISNLPYNASQIKGNTSRLFDLDERVKPKSDHQIPLAPLIPHQMKWDQHDSVRYSHINCPVYKRETNEDCPEISNIEQSKSTVFNKEQLNEIEQKKETIVNKQKGKNQPIKNEKSLTVEIKIMKGWNSKFMQGLSKHCKLNNSAIVKFEFDDSKVTLVIKRSQRWENVTDWLRKECKLKIRVMN